MRSVLRALVAAILAPSAAPQEVLFFTAEEWAQLSNEISGDRSFEHVRQFTQWHRPFASEGLLAAAKYAEGKARALGLDEVRLILQENEEGLTWTPRRGELWLLEPEVERICDMDSVQTSLADRSRPADLTAELVEVGGGTAEADYEGKEVAGKVVFAHGALSAVFREAVFERGAAGAVVYPGPETIDNPDQVRWSSVPWKSPEGRPGGFGFVLSRRQGVELARRLRGGAAKVRAVVEADFEEKGWLVMVEGRLRGTEPDLPEVVFTGHLQEERFSANDDASGCANTLEVARALARLVREGRLPRPRRSIRFWWTTEIASENRWFSDFPEEVARVLCNVNQDMVGANQGDSTLRVQNVTRLPWARAHLVEDVAEEIVNALVEGNTAHLNARGSRSGALYPRPVLARLGTRHRYNARVIPFHNSTDHQCFTSPPIGKPGFTFTNWPDEFIHTSADDLSHIDATQLQRNALAAAAIGYTMARAEAKDAPRLAAIVFGNSARRLGREGRVALGVLTDAGELDLVERFKRALSHVSAAFRKETTALDSVPPVTGAPASVVAAYRARLEGLPGMFLESIYELAAAENGGSAPQPVLAEAERELEPMRPRLAGTVRDYYERRRNVRGDFDLHGLMQWEVLSFLDGKRTGLEVYESVAAEARSGGEWLYGKVEPESVLAFLKACAEAEVVDLGVRQP